MLLLLVLVCLTLLAWLEVKLFSGTELWGNLQTKNGCGLLTNQNGAKVFLLNAFN